MGIALGRRAGGRPGLSAHPHFARWQEIQLLCLDGLAYARAGKLKTQPQPAGYEKMRETKSSKEPDRRERRGHERKAKKEKHQNSKRDKREETKSGQGEQHKQLPAAHGDDSLQDASSSSQPAAGGGRWVHVPS